MTTPLYASEQYVKFFFSSEIVEVRPTEWEVALHTGNPGTNGNNNELSSDSYMRQDVAFTIEQHSSGTHFVATNMADITFPTGIDTDNSTITHYTIRDKVADEALASGRLPTPIILSEGVNIVIPMGILKIRGI